MSNQSGGGGSAGDPLKSLKQTLIWSIGGITVLGVAAYFLWPLLTGSGGPPVQTTAPQPVSTPAVTAVVAEPPPEGTVEELLEKAKTALRENRVVSPPGVNAVEIYLSVLDKEPDNPLAKSGLVEILQLALQASEQSIGRKEYDDAERQLDLIEQYQPDSYTLGKLRERLNSERDALEAQRIAQERAEAEAARRAELAAQEAAEAERREAELAAAEDEETPAEEEPAVTEPVAAADDVTTEESDPIATTTPPEEPVATPPRPAVTGPTIVEPVAVSQTPPQYPPQALRRRLQGWVEVEFTITALGTVDDVRITASEPQGAFDREAIRAVSRWRYRPRTVDGVAESKRVKQRLDFNLGG